MTPIRKVAVAAALVGSTMAGGAIGAYLFAGASATAATSSTTTPPNQGSNPGGPDGPGGPRVGPDGRFHSNENAAHEQGESAQREAQENAGQVPTVP